MLTINLFWNFPPLAYHVRAFCQKRGSWHFPINSAFPIIRFPYLHKVVHAFSKNNYCLECTLDQIILRRRRFKEGANRYACKRTLWVDWNTNIYNFFAKLNQTLQKFWNKLQNMFKSNFDSFPCMLFKRTQRNSFLAKFSQQRAVIQRSKQK